MLKIDKSNLESVLIGGAIFGGGGGGWIEDGRKLAQRAIEKGFNHILSIDDVPNDAILITVSAVGSPSAGKEIRLQPEDYLRAVELFLEKTGLKISGLISSELGAFGIVNGWLQSVVFNIPVIDAPANGRAHPLGLMGSMRLHCQKGYLTAQTAVGGYGKNRVESFFQGTVEQTATQVLESAIQAGGLVAVARNPVPAQYVKYNGAPGAIQRAIELGNRFVSQPADCPERRVRVLLDFYNLPEEMMVKGKIKSVILKTMDGLDVGKFELEVGNLILHIPFWNEYMALDAEGKRFAAFPDLIITFSADTGLPLISAELKEGMEIYLISVPKKYLILGSGVKDKNLLSRIWDMISRI
ncbi:MAG: DUF917 family protein [bacterium]|nr:DUF917 family protein [bacterium]